MEKYLEAIRELLESMDALRRFNSEEPEEERTQRATALLREIAVNRGLPLLLVAALAENIAQNPLLAISLLQRHD